MKKGISTAAVMAIIGILVIAVIALVAFWQKPAAKPQLQNVLPPVQVSEDKVLKAIRETEFESPDFDFSSSPMPQSNISDLDMDFLPPPEMGNFFAGLAINPDSLYAKPEIDIKIPEIKVD